MAKLPYPSNFLNAVCELLKDEGAYVDDPSDSGGETKYGISKRSYPHLNIKGLTKEDAIILYYKDWWHNKSVSYLKGELLPAKFFNISVNMGLKAATKCLQKAIRSISNNKIILKVDGSMGANTLAAINKYEDEEGLYYAFKSEVCGYYRSLNKPKYINGWENRGYKK